MFEAPKKINLDEEQKINKEEIFFSDSSISNLSAGEEKIYVMPEKFIPKIKKKNKNKKVIILIILVSFFIILAIGIGIFFFKLLWDRLGEIEKKEPVEKVEQNIEQEETAINPSPEIASEQVIAQELKDEKGKVIGKAKLVVPVGAVEEGLNIKITAYPKEVYEDFDPTIQIIGPVYFLEPQLISLFKPVTLYLTCAGEELLKIEKQTKDLKIGSWGDKGWQTLEGNIDEQNNTISVSLDKLESYTYAIIISLESEIELPGEELFSGADLDKDGLTDEEEKIYKTNPLNSDSDGDNYLDGEEVVKLYSPVSRTGKLDTSGLINIYSNPIFKYSIFYPASWIAQTLDETYANIIFTSATGEFMEILTLDNPGRLSALKWYEEQFTAEEKLNLEKIKNVKVADYEGIEISHTSGQKIIYFGELDKIYGLIYNYGDKVELNFKNTFEMMKNSLKIE
ncbi:MAG: thrombospondin type 3 repeat-containing protein [Parcubacteria group bacterium Athens1014_10]|nr:MAG: thrombospondin type 3 repeat-containing protein [Parcubacteria group bacterium Athens1014_10]TSD06116.1 MAG: thrombospondin type 3 repeat-containing protein [Parcubacteria group bacterium Athens0714_12]